MNDDVIFDLIQNQRIRRVAIEAGVASRKASDSNRRVLDLEQQVGRLSLVCQGLWEIIRDRLQVPQHEVVAKLREIDLRDGRSDGQYRPSGTTCARCHRVSNAKHLRCIYCGEEFEIVPG
jgi:hypothetical protein